MSGGRDCASDLRCQQHNGTLVDSVLEGADAGNMTQLAAAILTVLIAAWLLWRRPGVFAQRQIPLPDSPLRLGNYGGRGYGGGRFLVRASVQMVRVALIPAGVLMVVATLLHPSRETARTIVASEPRLVAAHVVYTLALLLAEGAVVEMVSVKGS